MHQTGKLRIELQRMALLWNWKKSGQNLSMIFEELLAILYVYIHVYIYIYI